MVYKYPMDMFESFASVLREFGESINLQPLELDDNNACELCLDNKQNVQIRFNRERSEVEFLTELGDINESYLERSCNCFLKANCDWELTHGMTLSKRPDALKILLGYHVPALNMDMPLFENIFKAFIAEFETWQQHLIYMYRGELPEVLSEL
jgi:hypothetical protein